MWLNTALLSWLLAAGAFRNDVESEVRLSTHGKEDDLPLDGLGFPFHTEPRLPLRKLRSRGNLTEDDLGRASPKEILLALGGGTGAGTGSGNPELDQELLRRMRLQDKMVLFLMFLAYFIALVFSASLGYRQACNDSPVKYYGDPRIDDITIDSNDVDDFLEAFSRPPKNVQLQVQGLIPIPGLLAHMIEGTVNWQGNYYRHAFSFALDVSPWLVPEGMDGEGPGSRQHGDWLSSRMAREDLDLVQGFLQDNSNDLATFQVEKQVKWDGWEELATNIRQKIRQKGFDGLIHVRWNNVEALKVYKNLPWANFLHMHSTRTLFALSLVAYVWFLPYMWLRERGPKLASRFRIDVDIDTYWQLIGDKISERGFDQQ